MLVSIILIIAWLHGSRTSLLLQMVLKVTLESGAKMKTKIRVLLLQNENVWSQALIQWQYFLFLSLLTNISPKDVVPIWFMHVCPLCLGAAFLLMSPVEMRTMQSHWHLVWIPWPNIEGPYLVISSLHSVSSPGSQVTTSLNVFLSKGTGGWTSSKDSLIFELQQFPKVKLSCLCPSTSLWLSLQFLRVKEMWSLYGRHCWILLRSLIAWSEDSGSMQPMTTWVWCRQGIRFPCQSSRSTKVFQYLCHSNCRDASCSLVKRLHLELRDIGILPPFPLFSS